MRESGEAEHVAGGGELRFRVAGSSDAPAVAQLHATSWRRHYRGAYADAFLDGDVLADRIATWSERLAREDDRRFTILAEAGELVGFANTHFDHAAHWGALLDNLHVADGHQRGGVGSRLMALTAAELLSRPRQTGLYLWVLEQNLAAQAFYRARGGECVGREPVKPPGGVEGRLVGSPARLRFAWHDAAALLDSPA